MSQRVTCLILVKMPLEIYCFNCIGSPLDKTSKSFSKAFPPLYSYPWVQHITDSQFLCLFQSSTVRSKYILPLPALPQAPPIMLRMYLKFVSVVSSNKRKKSLSSRRSKIFSFTLLKICLAFRQCDSSRMVFQYIPKENF